VLHVWDESYSSPNFAGERFLVLSIDYCIIVEHLKAPNYRPTPDAFAVSWRPCSLDP